MMRITVVLLMLLLALPALAQRDTPPPVTFSSRSELVLVPVVVRSPDGQSLSGLTKDQFEIRDQGKKRDISTFEEINSTTDAASLASSSGLTFSNHLTGAQPARRLTIILLDFLNTDVPDQVRARKAVIDYIGKSLQPDEPTALLVLNSKGLRQLHSFSTSTATLIAAIRQADTGGVQSAKTAVVPTTGTAAGAPTGNAGAGPTLEAQDIQDLASTGDLAAISDGQFRNITEYGVQLDTMRAMEMISQAYAGIPGRKALMWVTAGYWLRFPSGSTDNAFALRETMAAIWKMLNGSNIAVYPIDVTGLDINKMIVGPVRMNRPGPAPKIARGPMREFDVLLSSTQDADIRDTYHLYADATGGRPCVNNNDLKDCLQRAARDSEHFYMLGFYVPAQERKPGWHKLVVKLNAKYADMRFRSGYLVDDPGAKHPALANDPQSVPAGFAAPVDYTGVPIDVTLTDTTPQAERHRVRLDINFPPNAFAVDREKNNHIELDIAARAYARTGRPVAELAKTLGGDLPPEKLGVLLSEGMVYAEELEIPPGKYQLKIVVRDRLTGKMGSVTAPIDVN